MKLSFYSIIVLTALLLTSCDENPNIIGLWLIDNVQIGDQEMTPIARWTRINNDYTQESGNGWLQHSIGKWEYQPEKSSIKLENSNGLKDEFGAFTILNMTHQEMKWTREEDGENVIITFKRIEKTPPSPSNELLGCWKPLTDNKDDLSKYLFFRWDRIVVTGQEMSSKKYGTYKTHGHKQELQIIYYEDPLRQEDWDYSFDDDNHLILESKDKEAVTKLEYERIDYIPQ